MRIRYLKFWLSDYLWMNWKEEQRLTAKISLKYFFLPNHSSLKNVYGHFFPQKVSQLLFNLSSWDHVQQSFRLLFKEAGVQTPHYVSAIHSNHIRSSKPQAFWKGVFKVFSLLTYTIDRRWSYPEYVEMVWKVQGKTKLLYLVHFSQGKEKSWNGWGS